VHFPNIAFIGVPTVFKAACNRLDETRRLIATLSHSWDYIGKEQPPSKRWQKSTFAPMSFISPLYIIVNAFAYFEGHPRDETDNSIDKRHRSIKKL
jgi:hypothetical protein